MDIRLVCNIISASSSIALLAVMGSAIWAAKKAAEIDATIAAGEAQIEAWDGYMQRNGLLRSVK